MNKHPYPLLYWSPRILGLIFVLFTAVFALDVFGEGLGFWDTLLALLRHLVPTIAMAVILVIAWRWELLGGWLCIGGGLLFNGVESIGDRAVSILWFPTVFVIVGVLFVLHERRERSAPSPP